VRNPWGEVEWNGDYGDKSALWLGNETLKTELGYEDEEDGSFFMLWRDFVQWFQSVDMCDPLKLVTKLCSSPTAAPDECRSDVFASHWVAGQTAGGSPPCEMFKFNPCAKLVVGEDGPVTVTLLQPDTRCLHHPETEEGIAHPMASVYITDSTSRTRPEKVATCAAWARQGSGTTQLKRGHVYLITAATFAPGQQGAFWITLTGRDVRLEPLPLAVPTAAEAQGMATNDDPYGCCVACHTEIAGSFFQTGKGPMCPGCRDSGFGGPKQGQGRWPPAPTRPNALELLRTKAPQFYPQAQAAAGLDKGLEEGGGGGGGGVDRLPRCTRGGRWCETETFVC